MKKLICIILVVLMIISFGTLGTSALEDTDKVLVEGVDYPPLSEDIPEYINFEPGTKYLKGDANVDWKVNILDATAIQFAVAEIDWLFDTGAFLGDVDNDGKTTIVDATLIQQYLVGYFDSFEEAEDPKQILNYAYVEIISLGEEPEQVKAGESVDLSALVLIESIDYQVHTDDLEYNMTITFENDGFTTELPSLSGAISVCVPTPGFYTVNLEVSDKWGDYSSYSYTFEVVN